MTNRRSARIANEKPGSEGDAEWVPQAKASPIRTEKGQPAASSSPGKRRIIKFRKEHASSVTQEDGSDEANESLGLDQIRASPELAEKRPLQVSTTTHPPPKRLKFDEFQIQVQVLEDLYGRLRRQWQHSMEKTTDLEMSAKDNQVKVKSLQRQNSRLSKHVESLKAEVAQLTSAKELIQSKCRELQEDRDEMKKDAIRALEEAKIHLGDDLRHVSIETVEKEWKQLIYKIHDLVIQNLTATPNDENSTSCLGIQKIITAAKGNRELQAPLLERYIWRYVYTVVFEESSELWSGDVEMPAAKVFREFRAQKGLLVAGAMKSRAAETIISKLGVNERYRLRCMQKLDERLAPFEASPLSTDVYDSLALVFDSAINIIKMLIKSQDIYDFGPYYFEKAGSGKMIYDENIMKISSCIMAPDGPNMTQATGFIVDVVQNPPLFVTSTAEGEHFGRRHLLCKAVVTVSAAKEEEKEEEDKTEDDTEDNTEEKTDVGKDEIPCEVDMIIVS